jgi:hypothetical protein
MSIWKFLGAVTLLGGLVAPAADVRAEERVLGGVPFAQAASSEIGTFISAYNEEGGMILTIVETAFKASNLADEAQVEFITDPLKHDPVSAAQAGRIVYPMYKPRCDIRALLTDYTSMLCEDFAWSAPFLHVIMSGYVAADSGWVPRRNSDLMGRTICQPRGEGAFSLRERRITELNARVVMAASAAACLKLVAAGESDIAMLPMVSAKLALAQAGLTGAIQHATGLDIALSMHAIAGRDQTSAVDQITAF